MEGERVAGDDVSSLVRHMRRSTRLSQRAFATLTGTSGPTVAAYESGHKEARLSTLRRLAGDVGLELRIRLVPLDPGQALRDRRERRSLAVAAATAAVVGQDFGRARRLAKENLLRAEELVGATAARRWVEEWRRVLEIGPDAVRDALLEPGDHGHDLRQMSPFAGLLSDKARRAVLHAAATFTDPAFRQ